MDSDPVVMIKYLNDIEDRSPRFVTTNDWQRKGEAWTAIGI